MSYDSPKRKREEERPLTPTLRTTSLVPRFQQLSDCDDTDGSGSPRTQVAGRFQRLDLDQQDHGFELDASSRETKRLAWGPEDQAFRDGGCSGLIPQQMSTKTPSCDAEGSLRAESAILVDRDLKPPASETHGRPKSPSLGGEISDQYWHESEITGHDPDDPNDDGYGINGIGFKPTPAIAWARSQKRKQQLADYRSREAKEARQRRSERRRWSSAEMKSDNSTLEEEKRGKVRFEEG